MLYLIKKIETGSINKLHTIIVLLGLLIATQIQYIQHGWINPDSVLYFESARLIADGHWKEAMQVYPWPLYSAVIACLQKISGLETHVSAQVLNVLFFSIATSSFISIIRLAGGKQLTMVAGALILFSSLYVVGDVLKMLLRDEGFWAFFLTGLVFFIRFYQRHRIEDAFLWQLCAIIATLFRIEAITYLIFLPVLFIFIPNEPFRERIRYLLTSHSLNIVLVVGLLVITLHDDLSMKNFGRLQEVFTTNLYELTQQLVEKSQIMSDAVLGKYLEQFAVPGLLLTFIYVIISKTISATGFLNVVLAGFNIKNHNSWMEPKAYSVLFLAIIISLINMGLIIIKSFVLSGRYVVALSWILMVFAAFTLTYFSNKLISKNSNNTLSKIAFYAVLVLMVLSVLKNVFPKQAGYNYMQDATIWIKQYNKYNLPVFYGNSRLRYYAGRPFIGAYDENGGPPSMALKIQPIDQSNFLLIDHSGKLADQAHYLEEVLSQYHEIQRFNGEKNRKFVVIYEKYSK